jgi:hypothetical protein
MTYAKFGNHGIKIANSEDLQVGMTVRPLRGENIGWTLNSRGWDHIVERIEERDIHLARVYALYHAGCAMANFERYSIPRHDTRKFIVME